MRIAEVVRSSGIVSVSAIIGLGTASGVGVYLLIKGVLMFSVHMLFAVGVGLLVLLGLAFSIVIGLPTRISSRRIGRMSEGRPARGVPDNVIRFPTERCRPPGTERRPTGSPYRC